MAPKKKKKKAKKKPRPNNEMKLRRPSALNNRQDAEAFEPVMVPENLDEWVTLDMKLLDWKFSDFQVKISTDTQVCHVKQLIEEKHCRVCSITICKEEYRESNELNDDKKTLKDYGMIGSTIKEDAPVITMHYNFRPQVAKDGNADPLLLSWV